MSANLEKWKNWITRRSSVLTDVSEDNLGWGEAMHCGQPIDIYYNLDLINEFITKPIAEALPENEECVIADFGCGIGHVAHTVVSQLGRPEGSVRSIGIDSYKKVLRWVKHIAPNVEPVQGNLLKLPFKNDSFDAGIFRFVLTFIRRDLQPEALQEIFRVLKPGASLVVFNYGVFDKEEMVEDYRKLFAYFAESAGDGAVDEIMAARFDPPYECLKDMARRVGFKVDDMDAFDLTNTVVGHLSPEICFRTSRYSKKQRMKKVPRELKKMLLSAFKSLKRKGNLPSEPGSLKFRRPMFSCVFKKPSP